VVRSTFSKLGPKHRLRAWVQLLALVVGHPDRPWQAVTIGRAQVSAPRAAVSTLRAPEPPVAARHLGELLALRAVAAREPLPLPVACACLYATSRDGGAEEVQALEAASQEWSKGFERGDDHHVLCWGADATLREIAGTPTAVEQAWWPQDRTRLGVLARRVWQPLLAHEETVTL
jgi:exodeoxyribonuclease V gamma subunit